LKNAKVAYAMLAIPMFFYFLFVLFPATQTFYISLTSWDGIGAKKFIGLQNYWDQWTTDDTFFTALKNNMLWAVGMVIIPQIFGVIQASLIVRGKVHKSNVYQLLFFLPQIISSVVAAIVWKWIYDPLSGPFVEFLKWAGLESLAFGWLGDPRTVVLAIFIVNVWIVTGFCTVVYGAAIRGIEEDLYEAAKIDGAGSMKQFTNITIPKIRDTMTTVTLMLLIWSLTVFDLIYVMSEGGPGYSSYVISLYVYFEGFIYNRVGFAASLSVTLTIFVLFLSLILLRFKERGNR